ncbi:MAG TPA: PD-(D/E)XK nuclease family protein, partial [Polyangiaceae bacterium]|nr:PD-(D/E)XK nuclease family protein [Polyangiaceae bacterium]
ESRKVDIEEVRLIAPRADLSSGVRRVLAALERAQTRILEEPLPDAQASGNLAAVRSPGARIDPFDRSLQLVRCHAPREAARKVAAALAADPGLGETLFIAPDGIVDEALAELGLPALGARSAHDTGALAELLPMTLKLAWSPVDPQLALDWLSLPDLPLGRSIARRLAETLATWPAVGNPTWLAIADAERKKDADPAQPVGLTLDTVFVPVAERRGEARIKELLPRIDLLERWAAQRAATSPAHEQVVAQAKALRGRFKVAELRRLTLPRLEAVLASVVGDEGTARRPASAGYTGVGLPGGVAGPARRVIWWGFIDAESPRRARVNLRASEQRALASIGVELPPLSTDVRAAASRARRSLHQTQETLILVAPQHDESGEPAYPHPLWDEIVGKLQDPREARHLLVDEPRFAEAIARTVVQVPVPEAPRWAYRTSLPLLVRPVESPTSLQKLLGCSFSYAVDYIGRLGARSPSRLAAENRLFGLLAHAVLAETAKEGALAKDGAGRAALGILDRTLTTHAALLLLPDHQQDLVLLRDAVGGAAELVSRVMQAEGLKIHAVEQEIRADLGARALRGTPDILLEDPRGKLILLDFKWSGESYRREELRSGTALQLAAYAALLKRRGRSIRALGYVILEGKCLLIRGDELAFAQRIRPEPLDLTWAAAERGWTERAAELSRGEVYADGVE